MVQSQFCALAIVLMACDDSSNRSSVDAARGDIEPSDIELGSHDVLGPTDVAVDLLAPPDVQLDASATDCSRAFEVSIDGQRKCTMEPVFEIGHDTDAEGIWRVAVLASCEQQIYGAIFFFKNGRPATHGEPLPWSRLVLSHVSQATGTELSASRDVEDISQDRGIVATATLSQDQATCFDLRIEGTVVREIGETMGEEMVFHFAGEIPPI